MSPTLHTHLAFADCDVEKWPPGISALLLIPGYRTARCEQTHSRGPLASPACWGTAFPSAPRSVSTTLRQHHAPSAPRSVSTTLVAMHNRHDLTAPLRRYERRDHIVLQSSFILTPPGGRIWAPCPTGSPGPVRAGCLVDTEQPWTLSSRALGHIALRCFIAMRCFTAFSMTCIGRPGGTVYLLSAAQ